MTHDYRVTWCDEGCVRCVDGLSLASANKAFSAICRELRKSIAWVHILRMPDRTTYASMDRATIDRIDELSHIAQANGIHHPIRPRNIGGELRPEDQA